MKVTKIVEVSQCEIPGCKSADTYGYTCMRCGIDYCYEHMKIHAVRYPHAVHVSGSGDGLYCKACDAYLKVNPEPLHSAYLDIRYLRDEEQSFYAKFRARADKVEENLKRLQP